jgi:hypothetical protein
VKLEAMNKERADLAARIASITEMDTLMHAMSGASPSSGATTPSEAQRPHDMPSEVIAALMLLVRIGDTLVVLDRARMTAVCIVADVRRHRHSMLDAFQAFSAAGLTPPETKPWAVKTNFTEYAALVDLLDDLRSRLSGIEGLDLSGLDFLDGGEGVMPWVVDKGPYQHTLGTGQANIYATTLLRNLHAVLGRLTARSDGLRARLADLARMQMGPGQTG